MKKALVCFLMSLSSLVAFADLYTPARFIEVGVQANAGVSNNYFLAPDYLQKEIVFDLHKIAQELPADGLELDAVVNAKTFLHIAVSRNTQLDFFTAVEGSGYVNISHELFDLLGEGYSVGDHKSIDISGHADVFASTGMSLYKRINGFGVTVTPSFFIPVAYVVDATATVEVQNTDAGKVTATATAPVDVYTVVDAENIKDKGMTSDQLSEAVKSGGFDIALCVEKQVLDSLDAGVFTRIPVVPGRMKHKMTANMYAYYTENKLLGYLDETHADESGHGVDDIVYSSASLLVHRPFRLGAELAWRPFGQWMTFRPMLACAARNPYTSSMQWMLEYALSAELDILKVLRFKAETALQNQVFVQSVAVAVNARLLEIDLGCALRGADFTRSFDYSGAGAYVCVKAGF